MTTFNPKSWGSGGRFTLGGKDYELRPNLWGSKFALTAGDGEVVATADSVGRKRWSVTVGGNEYALRRVSFWRGDQALMIGGRQVGAVRRTGTWRIGAEADLAGLDLPVQVFVLAVVVSMWRGQAAAAAVAGA